MAVKPVCGADAQLLIMPSRITLAFLLFSTSPFIPSTSVGHRPETTACIGGLTCHLATSEEIARAVEIYDLSDNEVQEPSILSAALLLNGAEDKYELEQAYLPIFSSMNWPSEEQNVYNASQTSAEKNMVVLQHMDNWAAEIEARQSIESFDELGRNDAPARYGSRRDRGRIACHEQ